MKILLQRIARTPEYTIGQLYIDGQYFCDTLENYDTGLCSKTPVETIQEQKDNGPTAIPMGIYTVTLDVVSPEYSSSTFMCEYANGGRVPQLLDVPGFDSIVIHTGNTTADTDGCILVGYNRVKGRVVNSCIAFEQLYTILQRANGSITITVA